MPTTRMDIVIENNKESNVDRTLVDEVEKVFGRNPKLNGDGVTYINGERRQDNQPTNNNHHKLNHEHRGAQPSQPLLEPDRDKQKPPLAGPEIDDIEDDADKPVSHGSYPGIDDGLLDFGPSHKPREGGEHDEATDKESGPSMHDDGVGTDDGKWLWPSHGDEPDYPYDGVNGLGPRFNVDDRPGSPFPGSTPDVNTYQQKKNLAQGMMDLALLSANANQLRYVLESSTTHPYYYSSLTLISFSIIFQIAVGIGLIMNSRYDVNDKKEICKADKINNFTVLGIFMITIVNVFIASFSVASNTSVASLPSGIQQAG